MIRFIDLRHVSEDLGGARFAFWDTVVDRFVFDAMKDQAWETIGQFAQGYNPTESQPLSRFVGLTPEWAKHAVPDREVFKVELHSAVQATARNQDESATCHVPLSPLVLNAMQGRKVAYFYGEQAYGFDQSVGAIEGQIVIDFDAEAEGPTW